MLPAPRADLISNTAEFETIPSIKPNGFREYDARWLFPQDISLLGIQALGVALATLIHDMNVRPRIVVGHDYRSYSLGVKQALSLGLVSGGAEVLDIGLALSPTAYFAQFALDAPCVAMVTASHNENGLRRPSSKKGRLIQRIDYASTQCGYERRSNYFSCSAG